jgi:hypothetical protein
MEIKIFIGASAVYGFGLLVGYYFGLKEIPYGYLIISLLSFIITYLILELISNA